ncbi:MAG: hypothetical protein HXY44_16170 [Syntrophaceae bacterium]|nr:hypothetical protein [Syntrophaceae bacterium]
MFTKKTVLSLLILTFFLWFCFFGSTANAKDGSSQSQLLDYAGKSYMGTQDPAYLNYDSALREYMVNRISKQYGIALDPKNYSGFDLLEIESLFKCKKSGEPFDLFFKMFPKHP